MSKCLIANRCDLFPSFNENLLEVCTSCEYDIHNTSCSNELYDILVGQKNSFNILFVDLELLTELPSEKQEKVKEFFGNIEAPIIGIGFEIDEAVEIGKEFEIYNCLLRYQESDQMMNLLKSLTFSPEKKTLRRYPRYLVNFPAEFSIDTKIHAGQITNMSVGGVFLKSLLTAPAKSVIGVTFNIEDGNPAIDCKCQVRHVHALPPGASEKQLSGMGLMFEAISSADQKRLNRLLAEKTPISSGLENRQS